MARIQSQTLAEALQVTIFPENVGFGNMRIITLISMVSWLPMSSSSSPFTYKAVEVIFGRIYFYFHLQTDHWLQALQVTIFHENVGFGNMRIITLISIVSWLPIYSSSSPFTYKAVEVIFGSIYFFFTFKQPQTYRTVHIPTICPHSPSPLYFSHLYCNHCHSQHDQHLRYGLLHINDLVLKICTRYLKEIY